MEDSPAVDDLWAPPEAAAEGTQLWLEVEAAGAGRGRVISGYSAPTLALCTSFVPKSVCFLDYILPST